MRTANFIKKNKYIVLLIGASRYHSHKYADIPNVETNIKLMKDLFLDPRYIGVAERNIIVSLNEDSKTIERKITDAKEMAKNPDYTLFVYYSGHGIINPDNYKLYFATSDMDVNYLDTDAIEAKSILEKISRSAASRKIFVVDACHSGGIHNAMGDAPETALMKNFEGVHYVSACDEDSTALFPKKMPGAPTYFTGALVSRIHNGMDTDRPYVTLREVVDDIASDFKYKKNLPVPQQSSMLNADQMPFAVNVAAVNAPIITAPVPEVAKDNEADTETEWQRTVKAGTIAAYYSYIERFPKSKYTKTAENKIVELEENEKWLKTESICTLIAYESYKKAYPFGKHISQANAKIAEFKNRKKDDNMWSIAYNADNVGMYEDYLKSYPNGAHAIEANDRLAELKGSRQARTGFVILFFTALIVMVLYPDPNNINRNGGSSFFPTTTNDSIKEQQSNQKQPYSDIRIADSNFSSYSLEKQADVMSTENRNEIGEYHIRLQKYEEALKKDSTNTRLQAKVQNLQHEIDSMYDEYIHMVETFLQADLLYPKDIEKCINCADALKPGSQRVFELKGQYMELCKKTKQ